jgi:hypothetical protein
MFSTIQQMADTNAYLWKELEHKDWVIKGLKAKRAFIPETVYQNPDGDTPEDLLDKVKDILAEEASTLALIAEREEE